ncbi:hypothetical protein [Chitinophaga solisilvae]|uniref:hypothetical protein n=1 Tax=Chitinophaga solisilvae TaxID=1233460 RepID=UPI001368DDCC|nr:hypothetical protein [Chitinophaga solisilvae]
MKKKTSRLSPALRRQASADMTRYYMNSYWSEWRYVKVLTLQKLLRTKYDFYQSVTEELYKEPHEATIAQEITHGLYYDTIAQCIQYIEDLFALIRASRDPDYFIKNIVTYQAGQITNLIKGFKVDDKSLGEAFHYPHVLLFPNDKDRKAYEAGKMKLKEIIGEILDFYREYEFFYIQYKHGLTIPIRPFGNVFSEEQVEKDKAGEFHPYLAVFDNFNLHAASQRNTFNTTHGNLMPGWTPAVMSCIGDLHDEDNYLRFVFPPDIDVTMDIYVSIAMKIKYCINIFKNNYLQKIDQSIDVNKFQLPIDPQSNEVLNISFEQS